MPIGDLIVTMLGWFKTHVDKMYNTLDNKITTVNNNLSSDISKTNADLSKKIVDTGYRKTLTVQTPLDSLQFAFNAGGVYALLSLTTGVTVVPLCSNKYDTNVFTVNNVNRSITITEKNGGNVRFILISG